MLKLTYLLLLTGFFSLPALSQAVEWTERNTGVNVRLTTVSSCDGSNAWICGEDGTVVQTSNGGETWNTVSISRSLPLTFIYNVSSSCTFTSGTINDTAYLYYTSNSGIKWITVYSQKNSNINFLWMHDVYNGIMVSDPVNGRWRIETTKNGGFTWDSASCNLLQQGNEKGFPNSFCVSFNMIWFGTDNHNIYYSTNYGGTWSRQTSPVKEIRAIWMHNNEGYAGGKDLIRTTNYGFTWTALPLAQDTICGGFGYYPFYTQIIPGYLLNVRGSNKIYVSQDCGTSWTVQFTAPSGIFTNLTTTRNNLWPFWAIRDNGKVSKGMVYFGIKKLSNKVPNGFMLHQNYPNPFNPTTKIKFEIPASSPHPFGKEAGLPAEGSTQTRVRLDIYNSLGQLVQNLVNEELETGEYEAEWHGSNYPGGIYFYKLQAIDNKSQIKFDETKRMILIK